MVRRRFSGAARRAGHNIESGAALIVSLVLLMVLTLLAISTMRTASLGLLMAGNAQDHESAFQLAQTGIEAALRRGEPAGAPDCDTGIPSTDPAVAVPALRGSYTTRICSRGSGITPGYSAGMLTYHYEVTADGATDQRDARSRLVQGYGFIIAEGR